MDFVRRTWAEIDLDALEYNFNNIRASVPKGQMIMSVVKADAYGHGDGFVAKKLASLGASWFGVSNIEEAISLRKEGITQPILVLGYTPIDCTGLLAEHNIIQAVISLDYAEALESKAAELGITITCHIKLDTGMTRVGFQCDPEEFAESLENIIAVTKMANIKAEGIFTHFAVADTYTGDYPDYTEMQFQRYNKMVTALEEKGVTFALRHVANSAATISYPEKHMDMVRAGIITYGLLPSGECEGRIALKPLMTLKTSIAMVKQVKAGAQISYGRTFTATRDSIIATVPIGYADGYNRLLSSKAKMLVNGEYAPVVGRVCMDQVMLDVTDIPGVKMGDEVVVFGRQGEKEIPVEELAAIVGTINYEMTCVVTKRVPRVYLEKGKVVGVVNHVMHQYC